MAVYTRQELTQLDADNIQSRSNIRNANEVCVNVINLFKTKLPEDGKTYDVNNFDENGNPSGSLTLKDTEVIDNLITFGNDVEDEEIKDIINSHLAIEAMHVIVESSNIRDEETLNTFNELYKVANNIIVQYAGKGKRQKRKKHSYSYYLGEYIDMFGLCTDGDPNSAINWAIGAHSYALANWLLDKFD